MARNGETVRSQNQDAEATSAAGRIDAALQAIIDDVVIPALLERLLVPTHAEGSPMAQSKFSDPARPV